MTTIPTAQLSVKLYHDGAAITMHGQLPDLLVCFGTLAQSLHNDHQVPIDTLVNGVQHCDLLSDTPDQKGGQ